jgi:hypothetical protein
VLKISSFIIGSFKNSDCYVTLGNSVITSVASFVVKSRTFPLSKKLASRRVWDDAFGIEGGVWGADVEPRERRSEENVVLL